MEEDNKIIIIKVSTKIHYYTWTYEYVKEERESLFYCLFHFIRHISFSADPYSNRNYLGKSSGFNATTSFISRGPDYLEAESKRRKFSNVELLRLFRSAGCNDDEIELQCRHNVNDTIVIENASFYAVQKGSLNCSRGPVGPLSGRAYGTSREDSLKETFFPRLMGLPRASRYFYSIKYVA